MASEALAYVPEEKFRTSTPLGMSASILAPSSRTRSSQPKTRPSSSPSPPQNPLNGSGLT